MTPPYVMPIKPDEVMFDFCVLRALSDNEKVKPLFDDMVNKITSPMRAQCMSAIVAEAAQAWDRHLIPTPDLQTHIVQSTHSLPPASFDEKQAEEWLHSRCGRPEFISIVTNLFNAPFWSAHADDYGGKYWVEVVEACSQLDSVEDRVKGLTTLFSKVNLLENLRSLKISCTAAEFRRHMLAGGHIRDVVRYCSDLVADFVTALAVATNGIAVKTRPDNEQTRAEDEESDRQQAKEVAEWDEPRSQSGAFRMNISSDSHHCRG